MSRYWQQEPSSCKSASSVLDYYQLSLWFWFIARLFCISNRAIRIIRALRTAPWAHTSFRGLVIYLVLFFFFLNLVLSHFPCSDCKWVSKVFVKSGHMLENNEFCKTACAKQFSHNVTCGHIRTITNPFPPSSWHLTESVETDCNILQKKAFPHMM